MWVFVQVERSWSVRGDETMQGAQRQTSDRGRCVTCVLRAVVALCAGDPLFVPEA